MLHLVLNNRPCPGSDQSNPRDRLRAFIFGHRCTDKDVLLKGQSSGADEEFSAPDIVHQLNQEKHFRVWKNLALHLIEQMGYASKSNCV
jgi:hypothetical protein